MARRPMLAVAAVCLLVAGCMGAPGFQVRQANDPYDDVEGVVLSGSNNRISSQSINRGTHIDAKGVYADPMAHVGDGAVIDLGLAVYHKTQDGMELGSLEWISFLADGETIKLTAGSSRTDFGQVEYNTVSRSAGYDLTESMLVSITRSQLEQIARAQSLGVKVSGAARSHIFDPKVVSPSFQANLRTFLDRLPVETAPGR